MDVLAALTDFLGNGVNIAWAVLGLGLVIFLHELGHFAVAKWCNVHVERFSIGFGPILFSWRRGETEYALSLIPFGGYVKMLGQDDADPSQMTSEEIAADPRSYVAKNVWQRMAIISAGVTMNVLSAVVFFAIAFLIGREIEPPVIGKVRPGMPAWQAGMQRGDTVTHFNGREVTNYRDVALNVAVSTGTIQLKGVHQNGSPFDVSVDPVILTRPQIGILPSPGLKLADDPAGKISPVVPGTAAARASPPFEPGDVIRKVGDDEVSTFAQFEDSLAAHRGESTTITVQRKSGQDSQEIHVSPYYFRTLGLRLECGAITAIQLGSPAETAGLQVGDKLAKINGRNIGTDVDPLRLPDEFARLQGEIVDVVVVRQNPNGGPSDVTIKLTPQDRAGWLERPELEGEPISIPAIGAAFHVVPFVLQVEPEGPASQAGVLPLASIQKVELVLPEGAPADGDEPRTLTIRLDDTDDDRHRSQNWSYAFWKLQDLREREVRLTVKEKDQPQPRTVSIVPQDDPTWPMPTLGLRMEVLLYQEQAKSVPQAFEMAYTHSRNTILNIYLTLRSLITQRLSYKELHGPVGIAQAAFVTASQGFVPFLLFLGFLSLNLAVLNFLPIPVLDGGHMVFLTWEAITRRKPSERVFITAQYAGMVFLLGLMGLVLFLDFSRLFGRSL
jgi:regulator of sigma E protease